MRHLFTISGTCVAIVAWAIDLGIHGWFLAEKTAHGLTIHDLSMTMMFSVLVVGFGYSVDRYLAVDRSMKEKELNNYQSMVKFNDAVMKHFVKQSVNVFYELEQYPGVNQKIVSDFQKAILTACGHLEDRGELNREILKRPSNTREDESIACSKGSMVGVA